MPWFRRRCEVGVKPRPAGARLLDKVDIFSSRIGCWLWTGALSHDGYPRVGVLGSFPHLAHRVAYEAFVGPIPPGHEVDHLCGVPRCINPRHLEVVTPDENSRRAAANRSTCRAGHAYDEANTRVTDRGWRRCRTCEREYARIIREQRRSVSGR